MNLDELLGINVDDPIQRLARDLLKEDDDLLTELVRLRRETMTQQEVADQLQISRPAVAAFERYDSDPRLSAVRRYALAVGAHVRHTVTKPQARQEIAFEMVEQTRINADDRSHVGGTSQTTGALHQRFRDMALGGR